MFPDRAALYVVAIEDRQYKDFKIHCKSPFKFLWGFFFLSHIWGGRYYSSPEMSIQPHEYSCYAYGGVYL